MARPTLTLLFSVLGVSALMAVSFHYNTCTMSLFLGDPGYLETQAGSEAALLPIQNGNAALLGQSGPSLAASNDSMLSRRESFDFFIESHHRWLQRKGIHIRQMKDEAAVQRRERKEPPKFNGRQFWQWHYEPSFHCDLTERIGAMGDGHKWVCNPSRITEQVSEGKPCLVYSFGSCGQFDFEEAVLKHISTQCEIHTFDPAPMSKWAEGLRKYRDVIPHIKYHRACLGAPGVNTSSTVQGIKCKPLSQIVNELGHKGRDIDLFKIDCETCEWDTFEDWIAAPVLIRQMNVELHYRGEAKAHSFFQTLFNSGYVVHVKEPNILGCGGSCIEYGLIKLATSFGVA
mmetsp:Transcript_17257/g.51740  ORF Transcript_17257/g.51740 Transcript_17257/m.51740 type:complete len:344 (-) Transcript_17257:339-1370(-)